MALEAPNNAVKPEPTYVNAAWSNPLHVEGCHQFGSWLDERFAKAPIVAPTPVEVGAQTPVESQPELAHPRF